MVTDISNNNLINNLTIIIIIVILQIEGEKVETVAYFLFSGSKITVVGYCSNEIKRCLLIGRKAMNNLDISSCRDIKYRQTYV